MPCSVLPMFASCVWWSLSESSSPESQRWQLDPPRPNSLSLARMGWSDGHGKGRKASRSRSRSPFPPLPPRQRLQLPPSPAFLPKT
eukprot:1686868-Alexandrium_andersonii.AAC.1